MQFRDGQWTLVVSGAILEEYGHVLRRPRFGLPMDQIETMLLEVESRSLKVIPSVRTLAVERDPADNEFIDVALEAKASAIVSGDDDLLALGSYRGILILTPQQFLSQ